MMHYSEILRQSQNPIRDPGRTISMRCAKLREILIRSDMVQVHKDENYGSRWVASGA